MERKSTCFNYMIERILHRSKPGLPDMPQEIEESIQVDPRPQEFAGFVDRNRTYVDLISGKDVNYILLREESPGYLRSLMTTGTLEIDGNIARLPLVQKQIREAEERARLYNVPKIEPTESRSWMDILRRKNTKRVVSGETRTGQK